MKRKSTRSNNTKKEHKSNNNVKEEHDNNSVKEKDRPNDNAKMQQEKKKVEPKLKLKPFVLLEKG